MSSVLLRKVQYVAADKNSHQQSDDSSPSFPASTATAHDSATLDRVHSHSTTTNTTTSGSRTLYSVASSRTRSTDYGLFYTRRALSMIADGDEEDQDWNSVSLSREIRVASPQFSPHNEVSPEELEMVEDSLPSVTVHEPPKLRTSLQDESEMLLNHEYLKTYFYHKGRLTEDQAIHIIKTSTEIFSKESNMVLVESPVTVCGDIHGQYYDLLKLFEVGGSLQENLYIFLGDYANNGNFGVECLLYLYALKINSPSRIVLLRGRHECRYLTDFYTFKTECLKKYSEKVYEAFLESFCSLPVSALIDGRLFCVHGGVTQELITLTDIEKINRFVELQPHKLLCDLVWSDPVFGFDHEAEPTPNIQDLGDGPRFPLPEEPVAVYTYEAVCQFLERNKLLTVIRGHEVQESGYKMHRKTKRGFPSVITIFSAPNHLNTHNNRGAVLTYANRKITIKQYVTVGSRMLDKRHPSGSASRIRRKIVKNKILAMGQFITLLRIVRNDTKVAAEVSRMLDGESSKDGRPSVETLRTVAREDKDIRSKMLRLMIPRAVKGVTYTSSSSIDKISFDRSSTEVTRRSLSSRRKVTKSKVTVVEDPDEPDYSFSYY